MRLDVGRELFALQFLRDNAIVKLRFDRDGRGDITVNEVINEMLGLGVLPLLRMDRECFFAERVWIALA